MRAFKLPSNRHIDYGAKGPSKCDRNADAKPLEYESKIDPRGLFWRLHHAVGPIAGGLVLDFADLSTFGPVGLVLGLFVGAGVGWWVASIYQFSIQARLLWASLAAAYCTLPFTAILPLATIISAVARFERPLFNQSPDRGDSIEPAPQAPGKRVAY